MSLPWQPIATAPLTGEGILAYGRHDRDAPPGASLLVRAGDHWWAILVWDFWRTPARGWVFAKDGAEPWSAPTHWLELTPPGESESTPPAAG